MALPVKPQITHRGNKCFIITWPSPELWNLPAPIIGYVIEQKRAGCSNWVAVGRVPFGQYLLENLAEGAGYEFRVTAVNVTGARRTSESTGLQLTLGK